VSWADDAVASELSAGQREPDHRRDRRSEALGWGRSRGPHEGTIVAARKRSSCAAR